FHAQVGAMHTAGGDEVIGNCFSGVDGNGKANACGSAARSVNCRIDADHVAVRIDQRTAGIAAVNGRVGLNRFFDGGGLAGLHSTADGADYAGGECGLEAERVSYGENFLAYLNRTGIPKFQGSELLAFGANLDERDVIALVRANVFRGMA